MIVVWLAGLLGVALGAAAMAAVLSGRLRKPPAQTPAQLQTLVGELAHRNRNALFVIMAISLSDHRKKRLISGGTYGRYLRAKTGAG